MIDFTLNDEAIEFTLNAETEEGTPDTEGIFDYTFDETFE